MEGISLSSVMELTNSHTCQPALTDFVSLLGSSARSVAKRVMKVGGGRIPIVHCRRLSPTE